MIKVFPKCPKCNRSMRQPILTDIGTDSYTQFYLTYCPYCIKLDDKIEVICWARTESNDNEKNETTTNTK